MLKKTYLVVILLLILLSSCKEETVSTPTTIPGQMETQVAQEVAVQLTEIALSQPAPTNTIPPTAIPDQPTEFPTPTDTPAPMGVSPTSEPASTTPVLPAPSNTASAPTATKQPLPTATTAPFACELVKQNPENGKTFKPGDDFDVVWTVKNTGSSKWDDNEVDYRYESGDKIHQKDGYDLPKIVKPGESIDLVVDVQAPDKEGKYKTTWVLNQGSHLICTLKIEIVVEK